MDKKSIAIFFLLLLVPFGAYFIRPDFVANDTYGTLLLVCQNNNIMGAEGASYLLFSVLPCNFLVLKALLFCLAFVSGYFIIKMATLFNEKNGWRACYLIFLSATLVMEFVKFENEQFAYPIMFASLYFFFHSLKKSNNKTFLLSLALLVPAGLIWGGAIYYLIAYSLHIGIMLLLFVPFILIPFPNNPLYFRTLLGHILRTNIIAEDLPLKFLQSHFILIFGVWGLAFERMLLPSGLFLFLIGAASNKFWILSLPFLLIGIIRLIDETKVKWLHTVFAIVAIILVAGLAQSVWLNPPTQEHWQAIDYALEIDNNINNDWGMGYWVLWKGGTTASYQSMWLQQPDMPKQIRITEFDSNCSPVEEFGRVHVRLC